jgi:hypothetical protein
MPNDRFEKVLGATGHRNVERWNGTVPLEGGRPNWSNSKVVLHTAIPAGVYGISMWQYADSGNVSFELSRDTQPPAPNQQPQQQPQQRSIDDDFNI